MPLLNKLPLFLLYSLFAMPVLPKPVSSILILVFFISCLVSFFKNSSKRFSLYFFLMSVGLFAVYVISMLYTDNLEYGWRKISTALPLLVLPLSLTLFSKEQVNYCREYLKDFLKTYVIAVGLLILLSTAQLMNQYSLSILFYKPIDFYHNLGVLHGMDTLYLSFHISIAFIISAYLFYISQKLWKTLLAAFLVISLFSILLFLAFKASLIAALLGFGILSILTNKLRLWILFGSGLTLMISVIIFSHQINERFSQLLIVKNSIANNIDSENVRSHIYNCNIELLPKAGFLGFGIGDGKKELNECFVSMDSNLAKVSYNTHNQYFSIVQNVGFLGLIIFLGSLFVHSIISLNCKNYLAVTMVVFLAVWMLAENILERQGGVMYFALFTSFLFLINFNLPSKTELVLSHEKVIGEINR